MNPSRPRPMGFHVSIEGGLPGAVGRAVERDCACFQVFCGNPRAWRLQKRSEAELEEFRRARREAGLDPLAVHACYLINPCATGRGVLRRSISRMAAELELSAAIGADYYVLHPGSHKGQPTDWGIERAVQSIGKALKQAGEAPMVLLESTASAHGPGRGMGALGRVLAGLAESAPEARVGLAVDSCHLFAAGYDLPRPAEVDRLVRDAEENVGLDALRLLHVNDSRDACGSMRDRHEHIGEGAIGEGGLRNLLTHPALDMLPLILETPWESLEVDRRNLDRLRSLIGPS